MSLRVLLPLCAAAIGLAACATPAVEAVQERLDRDTGTTVIRLASPALLLATAPRARNADPFVYLAPFATNRMGARAAYLWVATPSGEGAAPAVTCGTLSAALQEAAPRADSLGLTRLPYRSPAEWSVVYVMPIDSAWIECLGSDVAFEVILGEDHFATDGARKADLAQFAARISE